MARRETIHLDVKPRNIIMGAPPRLIDLSIAKTFGDALRVDHSIGTDAYMSPEQCDPARLGACRTARPTCGASVQRCSRRSRAIAHSRTATVRRAQGVGRSSRLRRTSCRRKVPVALAKPIMACLARDPAARPTADELAEMLEPMVAALPRRPVLNRLRPRPRWR